MPPTLALQEAGRRGIRCRPLLGAVSVSLAFFFIFSSLAVVCVAEAVVCVEGLAGAGMSQAGMSEVGMSQAGRGFP